jgi:hypothetical protein
MSAHLDGKSGVNFHSPDVPELLKRFDKRKGHTPYTLISMEKKCVHTLPQATKLEHCTQIQKQIPLVLNQVSNVDL